MRNKYKGVTLSATAIAIIAWMFLGYISFIVMASPFSILASARTARQAEQYAEFVASSLKLVDYSELSTASHARQSLTGEIAGAVGWESRVEIGAEQQIGSNPDNLQRIATIDIFQTGDTLSRYTLQVPLSSAGSGGGTELEYKIIYPGGSAASPGIAKMTSSGLRFVSDNPYPGYLVHCVAEMYAEGEWGETGWVAEAGASWNYGKGIKASQLNDDKIITVVGGGIGGGSYFHDEARRSGLPHMFAFTGNYNPGSTKYITEAPFRVKVYKLAKIK